MMKKAIIYSSLALVAVFVAGLISCKRTLDSEEFQGPVQKAIPADFTGVQGTFDQYKVRISNNAVTKIDHAATPSPVDFQFGGANPYFAYFSATLSHGVTWFISVKGQTSGAEFHLGGTSQIIDRTNSYWDGASDNILMFKRDEFLTITLSFLGDFKGEHTVTVIQKMVLSGTTGPKNYGSPKTVRNGVYYMLVDDFDTRFDPLAVVSRLRTTYADLRDGSGAGSFILTPDQKVNDDFSLHIKAHDSNGNSYCGGFSEEQPYNLYRWFRDGADPDRPASVGNITRNPEDLYFNVFIYGTGKSDNALAVRIYEDDHSTGTAMPTSYSEAINDAWVYTIQINWTGWKSVSVPYSSFKSTGNPLKGGSGNTVKEPFHICGVSFEVQSFPNPSKDVEFYVDHVSFTQNGPFQP